MVLTAVAHWALRSVVDELEFADHALLWSSSAECPPESAKTLDSLLCVLRSRHFHDLLA